MPKWVNVNDGSKPNVSAYTGTGHVGTDIDPYSWADLLALEQHFDYEEDDAAIIYVKG